MKFMNWQAPQTASSNVGRKTQKKVAKGHVMPQKVILLITVLFKDLNKKKGCKRGTNGSNRLKLLPLHPLVGLEATSAISTPIIAQHTALQNK